MAAAVAIGLAKMCSKVSQALPEGSLDSLRSRLRTGSAVRRILSNETHTRDRSADQTLRIRRQRGGPGPAHFPSHRVSGGVRGSPAAEGPHQGTARTFSLSTQRLLAETPSPRVSWGACYVRTLRPNRVPTRLSAGCGGPLWQADKSGPARYPLADYVKHRDEGLSSTCWSVTRSMNTRGAGAPRASPPASSPTSAASPSACRGL